MNDINIHQLYIDHLTQMIDKKGDGVLRPRVSKPKKWKELPQTVPRRDITNDDVWVWSDQHFGHANIIKYCDRPYANIEQMSNALIENHNSVVGANDVCIWNGDVGFIRDELINQILYQCNGYKILIIGNHDFNHKRLRKLKFDEVHLTYQLTKNDVDVVFTHYPMDNLPSQFLNVHGHTHNQTPLHATDQHINVSVEMIDYTPINLDDIIIHGQNRLTQLK